MAQEALYRKWRPQIWADVVSQEQVVRVLKNAIKSDRTAHAYLFAGPRGTGKTTVARILARAVNCLDDSLEKRPCDQCQNCIAAHEGRFMDIIEIDAASNTSVDDVRDLRDKINFSPAQGRMKVYIIDEVHMLSTAAFNALLKTLEEPPSHVMFILATTEIHKIPATVLSRCQQHDFRRFPVTEIVRRLETICKGENIIYEPNALTLIARQSTGAMRDAISMLDQIASAGGNVSLSATQLILGVAASQSVIDLTDTIIQKETSAGLSTIHRSLDSGTDPRQFARQMVEYLRQILIIRMGAQETLEIAVDVREVMNKHAQSITSEKIIEIIHAFNLAATEPKSGWHQELSLELALAESCTDKKIPEQIIQVVQQTALSPRSQSIADPDEVEEDETLYAKRVFIRKGQTPDPTVTKTEIEKRWSEVRKLLKDHDSVLEATLSHARLIEVKNGVLYLGFPRETIKNKVEENHRFLLWTSAAISNVLGKSVGVSCTIFSKGRRSQDSVSGGMVDTALQLGGKLVSGQ